MKKLLLLSLLLGGAQLATAQVTKTASCNDQILLVGIPEKVNGAVADGLLSAHLQRTDHQVVLVAGRAFTSTYYAIADQQGRVLRAGKFTKRHAGEYDVLDLGVAPASYRITFSSTPIFAKQD